MRRKLAIDPRQIEHRCNRTHLVIVRYHLFKAERIKQPSLVLLQPTHHGPFPPLTASTSGNHCSRKPSTDFCNKICQQETHAPRQTASLFDHLVGKRKHRWGNLDTQYLGGAQIRTEVKLSWSFDRNIADAFSL